MKTQLDLTDRKSGRLSDRVFETLCDAILEGTIRPGERLREAEVGIRLGVSRTPIREAFTKLQQQHLLEKDTSGAYLVTKWNKNDLWEVATLRATLEGLCVTLAIPNLTTEVFDSLEVTIDQMQRAFERGDSKQYVALDIQFHSIIWSCARHRLLEESLEKLQPYLRYWMYLTRPESPDSYESGITESHRELVKVLRKKDTKLAYKVFQEHSFETVERAFRRLGLELESEWVGGQILLLNSIA